MTRWFGVTAWPRDDQRAPICESDENRIPVPIGAVCLMCSEPIGAHDQGVAIPSDGELNATHRECMMRSIVGCYASVTGHGHDHDVPYRQDARRVQAWLDEGAVGAR